MEEFLSKIYEMKGLGPTLIAILVVQCSHLAIKVGEFAWEVFTKQHQADRNSIAKLTEAVKTLETQLEKTTQSIKSLEDIPKHMNRAFAALKIISGPTKWDKIKKRIMDDTL